MIFTHQVEEKESPDVVDGAIVEVAEEDTETNPPVSEHMEVSLNQILEKIDQFTQQVTTSKINHHQNVITTLHILECINLLF